MADGLPEIPIGEEFGFQISFLENPESTRPSDSFTLSMTDYLEHKVTASTGDGAFLSEFVMHATSPDKLIFVEIENKPKYAKEPTLIQLRVLTKHILPVHSKIQIKVPK